MEKKQLINYVRWCVGQEYTKEETIEFILSLAPEASRKDIAALYGQLKNSLESERPRNVANRTDPQTLQDPPGQNEAENQPSQPQSKATLIGAIFVISVVAIILTMCNTMCKSISNQPRNDSYYLNERVYCYQTAKDYAERFLVSPSTAKFSFDPLIRSRKESEGVFVYYIDSYVDSQNAFGVVLRSSFSAAVRYYVEQDKFDVFDFEFN